MGGIVSTSTQQFADQGQVLERRQHSRILPKSLIYVACGEANGGMVLNASDDGLAISMAIAIRDEAFANVRVCMNGLPQSIEVYGRIVWTTTSKKRAGIQLIDVTQNHQQQIRDWLALDGVRDVNLLPRGASEEALRDQPEKAAAVAGTATPVEETFPSLLEQFGGTTPESLGPASSAIFSEEVAAGDPKLSQKFESLYPGFRDNEWDLAAITMIPRKKTRPEGWSAFALALLWVAIPSFAIGILVGRRPLEQWLLGGDAIGKSVSRIAQGKSRASSLPAKVPNASGTRQNSQFELPDAQTPSNIETPATRASVEYKSAELSASNRTLTDAKLLNSMSTQESRALTHAGSLEAKRLENSVTSSAVNSPGVVIRPPASASAPTKMKLRESSMGASSGQTGELSRGSNVQGAKPEARRFSAMLLDNSSITPSVLGRTSSDRLPKTISIDDGMNAPVIKARAPTGTQPIANNSVPSTSASSRALASSSPGAIVETPPRPTATTTAAPSVSAIPAAPSAARSMAPSAVLNAAPALKVAPPTVQPPLHGVLLVARKKKETFLLKLPEESVAAGRSTSIRMQRNVMVPPQSLWHRRGPVAKLTVGDLLTQSAPEKPDAKIKPRAGETVTVRAFVDRDGEVTDLKPVSGRFALMPRVMRTIREWQFDQTLIDGKPVDSEVNVTVEFRAAN
jgi:hypothetical protein